MRSGAPSAASLTAARSRRGCDVATHRLATDLVGDLLGTRLVAVDTVTCTPSAASALAVAAPRPEAPPVMIAAAPFSSMARSYGAAHPDHQRAARPGQRGARVRGRRAAAGGRRLDGKKVDDVVPPVTRVALHPAEGHQALAVEDEGEQRLPEVPVGHRLAAVFFQPLRYQPPTSAV